MSHVTFDLQWESAMAELKELINLENPTDPLLAPKTLADFSKLYVKYLQVYKKLEDCYEQNVHAQKRLDLRAALEACIGRLLEIKSWVVSLNDGDDLISLEDVLMDMNLGPESMDLIPPRFMVNDNASMIDARNKILVRLEVDQDTRVILQNIKKKLLAEAKALRKKTGSKDAKKKKKEKKDEKDMTKFYLLDLEKPIQKPPKDKTAQRTVESIFSELAENGIIQCCPARMFSEFIGADSFPHASQECLSLAQVRRLVIEYCVLPQASNYVNEYAPLIKSVLLYGGESNGKTLLVHCACQATGATYINLSPRSIEGKYPGKQATKMVEMAFKVAKIMAPSVIYIDEVELVFMKDKKKMKAYGLKDKPGRIKSSLMKQVAMIKPGDRVLIIGTSSKPQVCTISTILCTLITFTKDDYILDKAEVVIENRVLAEGVMASIMGKNGVSSSAKASFANRVSKLDAPSKGPGLTTMFAKKIYVPYPDYISRFFLWRALLKKYGAVITSQFNISVLTQLSHYYSPGTIEQICQSVLTKSRIRKLRKNPLQVEEVVHHLYEYKPIEKSTLVTLQNWLKQCVDTNNTDKSTPTFANGKK